MLAKAVLWFGKPHIIACDARCHKAWGIELRPKVQLSEDVDDYESLSDNELGLAPLYPGTFEDADGKPKDYFDKNRQNKWCARACERSIVREVVIESDLPDFSRRIKNKHAT